MKFNLINFNHPLMEKLPESPTNNKIKELLEKFLENSTNTEELIQYALLVAKRSIRIILTVYPSSHNELDDMVSEACLIIMETLKKIKDGLITIQVEKFLNYLSVVILQQVSEMIMTNSIMPIPLATQRRNWKQGKETKIRFDNDGLEAAYCNSFENEIDFREALDKLISSPIEQRILELREARYTDAEIGQLLGLSQQTVNLLRFNLYQRYLDIVN